MNMFNGQKWHRPAMIVVLLHTRCFAASNFIAHVGWLVRLNPQSLMGVFRTRRNIRQKNGWGDRHHLKVVLSNGKSHKSPFFSWLEHHV